MPNALVPNAIDDASLNKRKTHNRIYCRGFPKDQ
jgi:hypothetical protein